MIKALEERFARLQDKRTQGSALIGDHAGYWCSRIGDYRAIARVEDEPITMQLVRVEHRQEVYLCGVGHSGKLTL
ncbi:MULTISPECIES: type II toxin-antitoxin system RelE/ParE family toxin [unclassified Sphingomonas]|uniref:type II toxin-antitoxin system RelE family toxin n=1 Tax=unclassified Sphingomonas TaxID=196159 RepID=UPI000BCE2859|nr:MAG: hypothetical protein B7Y98_06110 [Sphingomonas sp. 32-62-10]